MSVRIYFPAHTDYFKDLAQQVSQAQIDKAIEAFDYYRQLPMLYWQFSYVREPGKFTGICVDDKMVWPASFTANDIAETVKDDQREAEFWFDMQLRWFRDQLNILMGNGAGPSGVSR